MSKIVSITAGAHLSMLIRPKVDGIVVPLPVGTTCAAAMQRASVQRQL